MPSTIKSLEVLRLKGDPSQDPSAAFSRASEKDFSRRFLNYQAGLKVRGPISVFQDGTTDIISCTGQDSKSLSEDAAYYYIRLKDVVECLQAYGYTQDNNTLTNLLETEAMHGREISITAIGEHQQTSIGTCWIQGIPPGNPKVQWQAPSSGHGLWTIPNSQGDRICELSFGEAIVETSDDGIEYIVTHGSGNKMQNDNSWKKIQNVFKIPKNHYDAAMDSIPWTSSSAKASDFFRMELDNEGNFKTLYPHLPPPYINDNFSQDAIEMTPPQKPYLESTISPHDIGKGRDPLRITEVPTMEIMPQKERACQCLTL